VGVWWRVGNTKLLKHKSIVDMQIIIYMKITPVFCGDRLLLQVVVLVDSGIVNSRMLHCTKYVPSVWGEAENACRIVVGK
jgi:hypothetical protein